MPAVDIPEVVVTPRRGREGWVLEVQCPHCGKTHLHGGGNDEQPAGGHRLAHCRQGHVVSYEIVLAPEEGG